jgi:hypothetical protein
MLWLVFQMWQLTRLKPTSSPVERVNRQLPIANATLAAWNWC